ncbi:MAG: hypothetical protein LBS26_06885 [Campylobacteraceae bacterium]|jgi:hypothetical protein|nr:hypothetical protein [Campylobacteraceae bacterium]
MSKYIVKFESDFRDYKSDSIAGGRNTKKFLEELSKNVFEQSYKYFENYNNSIPLLLESESKSYSTFAAAIDKITPVHYSQVADEVKGRFVDFWCNVQGRDYYIELKKAWCNIGFKSQGRFKNVGDVTNELFRQLKSLKIDPADFEKNAIGAVIISGYHHKNDKHKEEEKENLYKYIIEEKQKWNLQTAVFTWYLPQDIKDSMDKDEYWEYIQEWVSIYYFVYSDKV